MRTILTLLVGTLVVVLEAGRGLAATTATTTELLGCYDRCTFEYGACVDGCCGRLLCSRRCVDGCGGNLVGCRGGCELFCSTCNPDGAFFDTATLADGGRTIRIGGPLVCPESATADVRVTLTQSSGGAVATGETRVRCPATSTSFTVDAHATDGSRFLPLHAVEACATARVHVAGKGLDSFQWCRDVPLVPEGVDLEE